MALDKTLSYKLYISFAQPDEDLLKKLEASLAHLKREERIVVWHKKNLLAGEITTQKIFEQFEASQIILLLISPDFFASSDCHSEMQKSIERAQAGTVLVIPILLRASDWLNSSLASLQPLPRNRRPIKDWNNIDQAFLDIVNGLRLAIDELASREMPTQPIDPIPASAPPPKPPVSQPATVSPDYTTETANTIEQKLQANNYDVFICYNPADKVAAMQLDKKLKERGILPWLDSWRPGTDILEQQRQQVAKIRSAVVLIGKSGIAAFQQMQADTFLRQFVQRGIALIPVFLEEAPPEPLPALLDQFGWVDFRQHEPDPMSQLIWGITGVRPRQ